MSGFEAAVTGIGLVTPAGIGVEANWETVCSGQPAAAHDPALKDNPVRISCRVPGFDGGELLGPRRAHRLDRFVQLALVAAHEAVAGSGLDPAAWDGGRVAVVLGTGGGGGETVEEQHRLMLENPAWVSPLTLPMYLPNMLAGQVSMEFGAAGHSLVVATACASGTTAIGIGRDLLERDRCDVVLAGAGEAMLTPLIMAAFARMGALSRREEPSAASRPFDVDRDGFVAGEGAGVLVLERLADARARGAAIRGMIVGYGASADAHHMTMPCPDGRGIEAALRSSIEDAGASVDDIDHVNAHGTSTPLNDRVEGQMLRRTLPGGPLVTPTKGVTGHLLGAAGAVEAIYTLLAIERALVPPTANLDRLDPEIDLNVATSATPHRISLALSNSFAFGGQNAVLAIAPA
ncbi:MAG TPA: beta-ketoacyl-[acyl-carrier-protein] synthase family protein [Micromonosporaceae bacterium]|nr:beta-ketoacyl-[acyl-carrier-protein] synthase family protein [Micromonosporaceae bacterium]